MEGHALTPRPPIIKRLAAALVPRAQCQTLKSILQQESALPLPSRPPLFSLPLQPPRLPPILHPPQRLQSGGCCDSKCSTWKAHLCVAAERRIVRGGLARIPCPS